MAQQIINDSPANSGLGDPLKVAFDKVNANFTEVYGRTNQATTGQFFSELGANIIKRADRLFVGDAVAHDGKSTPVGMTWVNTVSSGVYEYLEKNATALLPMSSVPNGGIGAFSSARTSTTTGGASVVGIASAAFAYNDFVGGAGPGAWAFYGTALRRAGCVGPTHGLELDIANAGTLVQMYPAAMFPAGATHALWLASGGESTATPGLIGTASCAIGIIVNDVNNVATFDKGIVFQNTAIAGATGAAGNGIAIAFAAGHQQMWFNNSSQICGEIVSNARTVGNAQRVDLSDFGFLIQDRASGATQFQVQNTPSTANYLTALSAVAANPPSFVANGSDTNIDILLQPKGTGLLKTAYASVVATVPANFSAARRLAIKDSGGTTYFIPLATASW